MSVLFFFLKGLVIVALIVGMAWGTTWVVIMVWALILRTIRDAWEFLSEQRKEFKEFLASRKTTKP